MRTAVSAPARVSFFGSFAVVAVLGLAGLAGLAGTGCTKKDAAEEPDAEADAFDAGPIVDAAGEADAPHDARAEEERAAWADAGMQCGSRDLPDCPLQAWMRRYATTMIGFGEISSIADVFDRTAKLVPDDTLSDGGPLYMNWKSICRDGAAAARAGDIGAAKAACRGCHTQYRALYHRELRGKPVPSTP